MSKDALKEEGLSYKYPFRRQIRDLFFYAEEHKGALIFYFILSIIVAAIGLVPAYLYGRVIDDLTTGEYSLVLYFIVIIAAFHLLYQVVQNIVIYKMKIFGTLIEHKTRIKTFEHLLSLDYAFFQQHSPGALFSRISSGSRAVRDYIKVLYSSTIVRIFTMIFSTVLLFTADLKIGIFTLILLIAYVWYNLSTERKHLELETRMHGAGQRSYGKVIDFFSNILIVKLLNINDKLVQKLRLAHHEIIERHKEYRAHERFSSAMASLMLELSTVAVLAYLAVRVMNGSATIGLTVMVFGYFTKFTGSVQRVLDDYSQLVESMTGMYRMSLIYEHTPTILEPENPKHVGEWKNIDYDHITFTYPGKEMPAIHNVTLKISKGQKVALVGRSGSGKSTITKLLMKLYMPQHGFIQIGETNTKEIGSRELYRLIKVVPQDDELMHATIRENVTLATEHQVSDEEIHRALSLAGANFVHKLPSGLDTMLGPKGMTISGGEKQRLCIARAILAKPEVLILDEATSHLDVVTEKKVHDSLHRIKSMTVIAVTHRISSLHLFDRIIVLENGEIAGQGTHRQLLRNKAYKKFLKAMKK